MHICISVCVHNIYYNCVRLVGGRTRSLPLRRGPRIPKAWSLYLSVYFYGPACTGVARARSRTHGHGYIRAYEYNQGEKYIRLCAYIIIVIKVYTNHPSGLPRFASPDRPNTIKCACRGCVERSSPTTYYYSNFIILAEPTVFWYLIVDPDEKINDSRSIIPSKT